MESPKPFDKREAELKIILALAEHLIGTVDLHFGYWPPGLEVSLRNVPEAQANHSALLISRVPSGTRTILDVGCGVGKMATRLIALGYAVEGVTPSEYLAQRTRESLGEALPLHVCRFEDLKTLQRYDLLLFSESFQYVQMEPGLSRCAELIRPGGHLLICDLFRTDVPGDGPLSGGPRLSHFFELVSRHPFTLVEDLDITEATAPTMELADRLLTHVAEPSYHVLLDGAAARKPLLTRVLRWTLRRPLERVEWRYFKGGFSADTFKSQKTYRLLLYRRTGD